MAEAVAERETQELESTTVGIYRTAAVVKGGRRFSFSALVVVGDRRGRIGVGYGKAPGVPAAIEKAQKDARKKLIRVSLQQGTLPHPIETKFSASQVRLLPAAPGTGVIAGATVRAVLELAGVKDCLTKSFGSTNQKNLCKATFKALENLQTKDTIGSHRGVEIGTTEVDERLEYGSKFAPTSTSDAPAAKAPVNVVGKGRGGGRKGRGGGGRGRGRGRGGDEQPQPQPQAQAGTVEPAKPEAEPDKSSAKKEGPAAKDASSAAAPHAEGASGGEAKNE